MDDRIPGMEPPIINNQDADTVLSSAAERRAFKRFEANLASTAGNLPVGTTALDIWIRDHSADWQRRGQLTAAQMQAEEIRKYRWIESEKMNCDLGKAAHMKWVRLYAAEWRQWFENHYDGPLSDCD